MVSTRFPRNHLVAILGKLGSDQDGEVLTAARFAHRIVINAKMSWDDVVAGAAANTHAVGPVIPDQPVQSGAAIIHPPHNGRWVDTALFLIRICGQTNSPLTDGERDWLNKRLVAWSRRAPRYDEAYRLRMLYRLATAPRAASVQP